MCPVHTRTMLSHEVWFVFVCLFFLFVSICVDNCIQFAYFCTKIIHMWMWCQCCGGNRAHGELLFSLCPCRDNCRKSPVYTWYEQGLNGWIRLCFGLESSQRHSLHQKWQRRESSTADFFLQVKWISIFYFLFLIGHVLEPLSGFYLIS